MFNLMCVCGHDIYQHQPARRRDGLRPCREKACGCADWDSPETQRARQEWLLRLRAKLAKR